ncbi:MAG TPA: protein kinase [Polyangiaceae bacterium]|nr:protein kinase [Polyangiaceae bacterium]
MQETQDPFGWLGATLDGKYRIDQVVGQGGFGLVYRAYHLGFNETVAVKCLRLPQSMNAQERERFRETFLAEGRLLHQLSRATAGIVQALDIGAAVSPSKIYTPYLVLEWLEGRPLDRDFAERRESKLGGRSVLESYELLNPAVRALQVAHTQGVAHRDIKPANLFLATVAGKQVTKVLDFGIAKVMSDSESLSRAFEETGATMLAFTARYGAPEQFSRRYGATGPWTDVFALALVFEEAIAGRPALEGTDAAQLFVSAVDPERRPTLRKLGLECSDALDNVLRKALAVDPRERYAEASAFWAALESAVKEPEPVFPESAYAVTAPGPDSLPASGSPASGNPASANPASNARAVPATSAPVSPGTLPHSAAAAIPAPASAPAASLPVPSSPRTELASARAIPKTGRSRFKVLLWVSGLALLTGVGITITAARMLRPISSRIPGPASTDARNEEPNAGPRNEDGAGPAPDAQTPTPNATSPASAAGSEPSPEVPPLAEPAPSAVQNATPPPGAQVGPLFVWPEQEVPAGPIGSEAFIGAYKTWSEQTNGLSFGQAARQCATHGLAICTESQWLHACRHLPALAKVNTWTSSVKGPNVVVHEGETCEGRSEASPLSAAPERAALCCGRAIAMTTDNLQKQYLTTTAERVLLIERGINQHDTKSLLELSDVQISVDDHTKTNAQFGKLLENNFQAAPELNIITDTCEVSVRAKRITKTRPRRKKQVTYQTQGWVAECEQTSISGERVDAFHVTYEFTAQSKLRALSTEPSDP